MRFTHIALAGAVLAALAAPALASRGAATGTPTAIHMLGRNLGVTFVDATGKKKPTTGDYEIAKDALFDRSGARIGTSVVTCTILDVGGTQFFCNGTNQLKAGDIVLAGRFSLLSKSYRLAIVGGTGEYAGARGWEHGTWLDAKYTKLRIIDTFDLASGA
jgi:hypothetical protein